METPKYEHDEARNSSAAATSPSGSNSEGQLDGMSPSHSV